MGNTVEKILIQIGINYKEVEKKSKRLRTSINKTFRNIQKQESFAGKHVSSIDDFTNRVTKGAIPASARLSAQFKKNEIRFQGWAMSIMFAGMAIQRVFLNIWKSATTTFNDVNHSVEGSVTSFDMLQGSIKYLWYTVGEALAPIAEEMIPIILRVQDWVENNQELVASIVKQGAIWGTILMVLGMVVLGFNGVFTAVKNVITIISAVAAGGVAAGIAIVTGIIAAIVWIGALSKKMGGFGEFLKSFIRGIIHVVIIISDGLTWIFSKVVDGFTWGINVMIKGLNWLIEKINKIPGVNIGTIGKLDYSKYKFGDTMMNYGNWEKDSWLAPKKTGYGEFGGLTPDFNNQPQSITLKLSDEETKKLLNAEDVEMAYGSMS